MRNGLVQAFVVAALIGGALGAFGLGQPSAGYSLIGAAVACAPGMFAKGPTPPEKEQGPQDRGP